MSDDPRRILPPEAVDLDAESRVTPTDLAIAPRFWQHYGTPLFRRLLNAKAEK
jgi:hypothetical protein